MSVIHPGSIYSIPVLSHCQLLRELVGMAIYAMEIEFVPWVYGADHMTISQSNRLMQTYYVTKVQKILLISSVMILCSVYYNNFGGFPSCSLQGGNTPLHCACYSGHGEVVSTLVKAGANIEAVDRVRLASTVSVKPKFGSSIK